MRNDELVAISGELSRLKDGLAANERAYGDATVDWKSFGERLAAISAEGDMKGLHALARELEASFRPRWERAQKERERVVLLKVAAALKHLALVRDGFKGKSRRFREEHVQESSFEKVLAQANARIVERVKLLAPGATHGPNELLRSFRESVKPAIVEEYSRVLREQVLGGYEAAIERSALVEAVSLLLPKDPEERARFERILTELDLALAATMETAVTRETQDLDDSAAILAQGAAAFADPGRRYQLGLTQVLADKLPRCSKNMEGYLSALLGKHLAAAEERLARFLESDDLVSLVSVNAGDIALPEGWNHAALPGIVLEHFEAWKKLEAALKELDGRAPRAPEPPGPP